MFSLPIFWGHFYTDPSILRFFPPARTFDEEDEEVTKPNGMVIGVKQQLFAILSIYKVSQSIPWKAKYSTLLLH